MYATTWGNEVTKTLLRKSHTDTWISKSDIPSIPNIFKPRAGLLTKGVLAHYSAVLPDGKSIHLKEYADHYEMHWDKKDPNKDPLGHLLYDAPHWLIALGVGADFVFNNGKITKSVIKTIFG